LALVTGASSGIGWAIACEAARDGHDLIVTARRGDRLADLARLIATQTSAQVTILPEDLSDRAGPERLWTEIERRGLVVDVLVNNAGFGIGAPFAETELQRLRDLLDINIAAPLALMRLALPGMLARRRGRIANVASMSAFQPVPLMAAYGVSKAFVLSLSEAVGEEVRDTGVTITAICPGTTRTTFFDAAGYRKPEDFTDTAVAMSPEDVAAIAWAGTMAGAPLVVPGRANRAIAVLGRLLPRRTLARAAMRVMAERH
jgi:short-subunit dehydrogenase